MLMPLRLAVLIVLFFAFPAGAADRTIYLTFDDGPLTGTSNILDVLEAEQVPATLFMVGMHAQANALNKALVQRAKRMPLVTIGTTATATHTTTTGTSTGTPKGSSPTCCGPTRCWG
ncbi:polysaccharide deacetylase family protein [Mesorhizobium sp. M0938]|uniref:polysaccharide deacetylase family protein n=1 Tax=unclassified Mesorhizobium TaxID=325217 RepID=UPI00333890AE